MNTTNIVVLASIVTVTGQWSEGKGLSIRVVIGATIFALMLGAMNEASPKLAQQFALLLLVAVVWRYGRGIVNKTGIAR